MTTLVEGYIRAFPYVGSTPTTSTNLNLKKNYFGHFVSYLLFQPSMKRVFGNPPRAFPRQGGGSTNKICFALHARADEGKIYKIVGVKI